MSVFLTSGCLSIISIYDALNAVFDNGLFQLSEETSCFFTRSAWQGTKKCILPAALGLPEDMSYYSALALEFQGFFYGLLLTWLISKRFIKELGRTSEWNQKWLRNLLWNSFPIRTTVVNQTFLVQTQRRIVWNIPKLKVFSVTITILRDVSATAIIQCQVQWTLPHLKISFLRQ